MSTDLLPLDPSGPQWHLKHNNQEDPPFKVGDSVVCLKTSGSESYSYKRGEIYLIDKIWWDTSGANPHWRITTSVLSENESNSWTTAAFVSVSRSSVVKSSCLECGGTGEYVGFITREPCRTCKG